MKILEAASESSHCACGAEGWYGIPQSVLHALGVPGSVPLVQVQSLRPKIGDREISDQITDKAHLKREMGFVFC